MSQDRLTLAYLNDQKMQPKPLTPTESLEKVYRFQSGNREQIDRFKDH